MARATVSSKSSAESSGSQVSEGSLHQLQRICSSPESHPFLRPFGNMVSVVHMAVQNRTAPFPVAPALAAFAQFIEPSIDPAKLLAFAIEVHTKDGAQQSLGGVGGALAVLAQVEDRPGLVDAVQDMLEKWEGLRQSFTQRCRDVWELYVYFVFLDIKGDRILAKFVIQQLCALLECSSQRLSLSLSHTRPWVPAVLQGFADKDFMSFLPNLHTRVLRDWHGKWQAQQMNGKYDRDTVSEFWEGWFTGRFKVPWPDFLDAFQASYFDIACPSDMATKLHSLMDPAVRPNVGHASWQALVEKHGSINGIMQVLLDDVANDITSYIYREQPLQDSEGVQLDQPSKAVGGNVIQYDEGGSVIREDGRRRGSSHKRPTSNPYTKSSDGVMKGAASSAAACEDMSACETPPDRLAATPSSPSELPDKLTWQSYCNHLSKSKRYRPWWLMPGEVLPPQETAALDNLRVNAVRMVQSSLVCTDRALALRIMTGDLALSKPILETMSGASLKEKWALLPAVVVMANGGHACGVSTFGRGSTQGTPVVDHLLPEPIISRSHFSITLDQSTHKYCLSDNGTKWGTFVQIGSPTVLKCGDWIRVGVAEFVVRYCGGSCSHHQWHGRYHAQSSVNRSRQYGWQSSQSSSSTLPRECFHEMDLDSTTEEGREAKIKGEIAARLHSNVHIASGWTSTATRLSQQAEARRMSSSMRDDETASNVENWKPEQAPIKPLEIEFISGPRMGEKVVMWDRVGSLGRCASNTVQVHDPSIANVSRVHCIFEYIGDRWQIRDNKSTNGTWRRLSCILEPSSPLPLNGGEVIMAGGHEFKVEVLKLPAGNTGLPYVASEALDEIMYSAGLTGPQSL
jgi:pSer/pThr/pTyr-binding forkhead associated (FHA) protein